MAQKSNKCASSLRSDLSHDDEKQGKGDKEGGWVAEGEWNNWLKIADK